MKVQVVGQPLRLVRESGELEPAPGLAQCGVGRSRCAAPNIAGSATLSMTVRCANGPRDLVGARDAGPRNPVRVAVRDVVAREDELPASGR